MFQKGIRYQIYALLDMLLKVVLQQNYGQKCCSDSIDKCCSDSIDKCCSDSIDKCCSDSMIKWLLKLHFEPALVSIYPLKSSLREKKKKKERNKKCENKYTNKHSFDLSKS